ncbi:MULTISPECIES: hypothetical protein [unclassified Moorena]|uniref:hypothetical protein n=1 Tax=unclassified Moorena TaxID=2683338 RepID=UPI0013C67A09|nr:MULTISPECIES: hypothetical protein [unclassified Moorena]NEO18535.1 hypothetical protein [Moorena sp. SIO4A5]NEQ58381.1 hypothetical protein [Moorena sp. SIO4A1]
MFSSADLASYSARAYLKLKLCFVPGEVLFPLINKYPEIREHFWSQAQARNALLVSSPTPPITPSDHPPISPSLQGYVFKIHPELKTGTCAGEAEKSGTKLPMGKGSPLNAAAKITISPRRKQLSFRGALVFND